MSRKMSADCLRCEAMLGQDETAFVRSFECTFCEGCATGMGHVRPNCGGELVRRPRRKEEGP